MDELSKDRVREVVREQYGAAARGDVGCAPSCCAPGPAISAALGYSEEEMSAVPEGANLGLGCGNPQAIAALREGETVLDLGSGAGFDAILAARRVGAKGHVIGVDMTPDMISKARANVERVGLTQVEFRLGEIERLPVADDTVDVVLSNCVINLSPDKESVFRETFRVLKPGGRLAIADVVATADMPPELANDVAALTGCVAGAARIELIEAWLRGVGFVDVKVSPKEESRAVIAEWFPGGGLERFVVSATIEGVKPSDTTSCCAPACCGGDAS
ncbi:MAG: arsenite methyltransferase [Sandaracinus sp.]|nr:arsenite methyltransferase [Sandaracinus sp.]